MISGRGVFQVLSNNGQEWLVRTLPNTSVRVTGKATAYFLAPNESDRLPRRRGREDILDRRATCSKSRSLTPAPSGHSRRFPRSRPGEQHLREGAPRRKAIGATWCSAPAYAGPARDRGSAPRLIQGPSAAMPWPAGRKAKSAPAPPPSRWRSAVEITVSKAGKLTVRVSQRRLSIGPEDRDCRRRGNPTSIFPAPMRFRSPERGHDRGPRTAARRTEWARPATSKSPSPQPAGAGESLEAAGGEDRDHALEPSAEAGRAVAEGMTAMKDDPDGGITLIDVVWWTGVG